MGSRRIRTHFGHQFVLIGQHDLREVPVESVALHQAVRFDPPDPDGVPSMYTQRLNAGGFPIVASAKVNPYALEEARYLVNQMLGDQNELRQAIIASGAACASWHGTNTPPIFRNGHGSLTWNETTLMAFQPRTTTTVGPAAWGEV